ncbi:MAG: TRAP transporter small permease [Calditrichia bacterium]|nr:TRAP transporter small permease [Calditrichia bacterium]
MNTIRKINNTMAQIETWILVTITLSMVFGAFLQVVLRGLFNTGFEWGDIVIRHLVLWIGFIGASLATKQEKHINIDVFARFAGKKHKTIARIVTDIFAIIISLILAKAGYDFVLSEIEFSTPLFGNVKPYYFEIIIPIGYLLIALRFLFNLIDYLAEIRRLK